MRHLIKGLIAAAAVMVSAPAAMACGYSGCAAPVVSYGYVGCGDCGGWVRERLPDPQQQYYWVSQGPTYTGPGNLAPHPVYREGSISGYGHGYNRPYHRAHRHHHHRHGYYHGRKVLSRYN
jgi:hypothetical protein